MNPNGIKRALWFAGLALAIGFVAVVPGRSQVLNSGGTQGSTDGGTGPIAAGPSTPGNPRGGGPKQTQGGGQQSYVPQASGLQCTRSKNGSNTDVGVTAGRIKLASTVVQSGIGSSFLRDSPNAMLAIARKVSHAGGVCGRLMDDLSLVDDGWDRQRGLQFLKSFINEGTFALPVVPSSEGLTAAIEAGEIDKAGIPVVGTDGMLRQQYLDPWVWPVATATESTMRIMAKHAYAKGSRTFGIVYDTQYRFGIEGAEAFRAYVKKLPGASLKADVGIYPARASYSSEIQSFNSACNGACDFVAMLLEPQTALTWIAGRPQFGRKMTAGAQTLFNTAFASSCGKPCAGMIVWTGYNPPIGNLAGLPGVQQYVNDVRSIDPKIDVTNQFLEGAYLGMSVFVQALERVGPQLTRAGLRRVLNTTCFTSDLATKLCWSETSRHANKAAQGFSIVVAQGSFAGFKNEQTGFVKDPTL